MNKITYTCALNVYMGSTSKEALLHTKKNLFSILHRCNLLQFSALNSKVSMKSTCFLAGTVFWRFHSLRVWSSETVTSTGSTGWKARARTPSK